MNLRTAARSTDASAAVDSVTDVCVWTGTSWRTHADVMIVDGAVADVRDHRPATVGSRTLDGRGGHLLPGFVNTHTHVQQSLCRGVGEGRPLLSWLLAVGEAMLAVTPERAYLAGVAAALEGLRSGATTLVEHGWPHPDPEVQAAVLRAFDDVGVRAVLGVGVADRPDPTRRWGFEPRLMKPVAEILADVDALRASTAGSRVTPALAVPNPRSLTSDGLAAVRAHAEAGGLTAMVHLAETGTDDAMCREHAGIGAVDLLAKAGFLWYRLLAVHGVELPMSDAARLAEHGVAMSWNPVSNMRLGSGVAPVPEWLGMGLAVGIGVDGAGSNDRQDMLETLRAGAYVQRATHKRADLLDAATMLRLACDGAGAALGMPAPPGANGGVVPGRAADLTLVRFDRDFACLPVTDPGASLLTTGTSRVVDTVLVGGEVVVADGRSTRIDVPALTAALLEVGRQGTRLAR